MTKRKRSAAFSRTHSGTRRRLLGALAAGAASLQVRPLAAAHEPDAEEIALGSLVDAELAFARMASERGVRAAFLANFAADGVVFEPKPARLRETWESRPPPADPLAFHLQWKPMQAGVSRDHRFGYTTGPYTAWVASQPQRKRHGVFFSVWQRAGERWEVVLDAGTTTPGDVDFAALGAAPRAHFRGRADRDRQRMYLLDEEARGVASGTPTDITPTTYARLLADDARLHRDGNAPIASRAAVAREVAYRMARVTWSPMDAHVSAAGDMAVSYGGYRESDRASKMQAGYYAHLWLRDGDGRWRLAYDIALPEASP